MSDHIFTLTLAETNDGDTDVLPLKHAYRSLEAAKTAALEFAQQWFRDLELDEEAEVPTELQWVEGQSEWTASLLSEPEQSAFLVLTEHELL